MAPSAAATGSFARTSAPIKMIPNLQLWLRGDNHADVALGGTITSWRDESGNARDFTTTTGTKPSREIASNQSPTTLNKSPQGLYLVKSEATENIGAADTSLLRNVTGATGFLVSNTTAGIVSGVLVANVAAEAHTRFGLGHGRLRGSTTDAATVTVSATNLAAGDSVGWTLTYGYIFGGVISVTHVNARGTTETVTGAIANQAFPDTALSSLSINQGGILMNIGELAIYSGKLNDSHISRVVSYLCHKYRIAR